MATHTANRVIAGSTRQVAKALDTLAEGEPVQWNATRTVLTSSSQAGSATFTLAAVDAKNTSVTLDVTLPDMLEAMLELMGETVEGSLEEMFDQIAAVVASPQVGTGDIDL